MWSPSTCTACQDIVFTLYVQLFPRARCLILDHNDLIIFTIFARAKLATQYFERNHGIEAHILQSLKVILLEAC